MAALGLGLVYFSVTIDGDLIHQVLNTKLRTFRDVKVFAGDYFHPAADASYKNLIWNNLPTTTITTTLADMEEVTTPSPASVDHPTSGEGGNHTGQNQLVFLQ